MFGYEDELQGKINDLEEEVKKWKEIAEKMYISLNTVPEVDGRPWAIISGIEQVKVIREYEELLNNLHEEANK